MTGEAGCVPGAQWAPMGREAGREPGRADPHGRARACFRLRCGRLARGTVGPERIVPSAGIESASADFGSQHDGRGAGGGALRRHAAGHGAAARGRRAGGKRRPRPPPPWPRGSPGPRAPASGLPTLRVKSRSNPVSAQHLAPKSSFRCPRVTPELPHPLCAPRVFFAFILMVTVSSIPSGYSLEHPRADSSRCDLHLTQNGACVSILCRVVRARVRLARGLLILASILTEEVTWKPVG